MSKNYKVIDMPATMRRSVVKPDPVDSTIWVRDEKWYEDIRIIYGAFIIFLNDNNLLKKKAIGDLEETVIWIDDFNERGKKLIKSGAFGRWLDSFDRPGSKKSLSDTGYLERALKKLGITVTVH